MSTSRPAFTLVELLVVVAILVLLVSLLLPSLHRAQELAHRAICANNQRILTIAVVNYAHENNGWGPPHSGKEGVDWSPRLDPYLGYPPDMPKEEKIWYYTNGCPTFRKGRWNYGTAFALNNHVLNPYTDKIDEWVNLQQIGPPSALVMWADCFCAAINYGPVPTNLTRTLLGQNIPRLPARDGSGTLKPRHLAEGLNFAYLDGHTRFLLYYPIEGTPGTFVPINPRFWPY